LLGDKIYEWNLEDSKKEMQNKIKQQRVHNGALVAKMMVSFVIAGQENAEPEREPRLPRSAQGRPGHRQTTGPLEAEYGHRAVSRVQLGQGAEEAGRQRGEGQAGQGGQRVRAQDAQT